MSTSLPHWCLPVLLAFAMLHSYGQELVVNGSFEDHGRCPEGFGRKAFRRVEGVEALDGQPAYFHSCAETVGTPENWAGHQTPKHGNAYAGMVLTSRLGDRTDRQFIHLELKEPLINGHRYRLSFWVSAADRTGYSTDRIGACFLVGDRVPRTGLLALIGKADVENPLDRYLADTVAWMKVEGVYHARGGERSVVIGNFQPYGYSSRKAISSNTGPDVLRNTKRRSTMMNDTEPARSAFQRKLSQAAYVYLDAISLLPMPMNAELDVLTRRAACADLEVPLNAKELVPDVHFDRNGEGGSTSWSNASGGTPDLLEGRTGIYLFSAVNAENREFIGIPLNERTDPCARYRFSMRVLRDPSYGYAVDRIGMALADQYEKVHERGPLPYATAWSSPRGLVMDNTSDQITFCGAVDHVGCATHLLIGNFDADSSTTVRTMDPNGGPFAYYFVDDVSLLHVGTKEGCTLTCDPLSSNVPPVAASEEPRLEHHDEVLPIRFGTSSHVTDTIDRLLVERVRSVLKKDPTAMIHIQGHTDDSGAEDRNRTLSRERAKTVERFLVAAGVPERSLVVEHFGSERPLASNETPEGRALNRRVDVLLPEIDPAKGPVP